MPKNLSQNPNLYFSIDEAAKVLGVSKDTLRRHERRGRLTSIRTPGGHRRYSLKEIERVKYSPREIKIPAVVPVKVRVRPLEFLPYKPFDIASLYQEIAIPQKTIVMIAVVAFAITLLSLVATKIGLTKSILKYIGVGETISEGLSLGSSESQVLAAADVEDFSFRVEIPSTFASTLEVVGDLTAPNVLYGVTAGEGISITGDLQTPTISTTDQTAGLDIFSKVKVGSTEISAATNADTLELAAGSNVSLSTDTTNKKVTITASSISTPVSVANGGTGLSSYSTGNLLYASGTTAISKLAIGSSGQLLSVSGGIPSWTSTVSAGSSGVFGYWQRNDGALSPANITDDLLIGAIATASAKISLNANTGLLTTTTFKLTSGATAGYFLVSDGAGVGSWTDIATSGTAGPWTLSGSSLFPDANTYNLLVGSVLVADDIGKMTVKGAKTGKALVVLDETGDQNILVASASGTNVFSVSRAGNVNFTGKLLEDGNEILSGMIAPFASACPTGWTEYTSARGRYVVGNISGGTIGATVGTAFTTDQENRPVGQHNHGVTDPGHTHSVTRTNTAEIDSNTGYFTSANPPGAAYTHNVTSSTTGITINNAGSVAGTNAPYIQLTYCQKTAGADLAEWIPASENISAETIVSIDPNNNEKVIVSMTPYDPTVIGIIATKPGWLIGSEAPGSVQMALAGRVPTRVSLVNGEIKRGDPITTSSIPGVGMKATKEGAIIGKAMEPLNRESSLTPCGNTTSEESKATSEVTGTGSSDGGSSYCGTITVFVNPSWTDPKTSIADASVLLYALADDVNPGDVLSLVSVTTDRVEVPVVKSSTSYDPKLFGIMNEENVPQNTGRVPVKVDPDSPPIAIGDFLTSSSKPGLATKATKAGYTVGKALEAWSCAANSSTSKESKATSEVTGTGSSDGGTCPDRIEAFVNLGYFMGGITSDGYVTTNSNFIANDIKVKLNTNDELRLFGNPTTQEVPSVLSASDSVPTASNSASPLSCPSCASFTGQDYLADVSVSAAIGKILDKIEVLENDVTLMKTASPSSSLSTGSSETQTSLTVLGNTLLSDTVVNGKLNIGTLSFDNVNSSIDAIGDLNIQSLSLGSVNLQGGKIKIDKDGNLNIKSGIISGNDSIRGNLELAAGQTKVDVKQNWQTPPKAVVVAPSYITAFSIIDLSEKGFSIEVGASPLKDERLYWMALW